MIDLIAIGDIKLDTFVLLNPNSPQARVRMPEAELCLNYGSKVDVEIVDTQIAGSAPNVATGIARMGFKTDIISTMGADTTHDLALQTLTHEHVGVRFIEALKKKRSSYSVVLTYHDDRTILTGHIKHNYHLPTRFPKPTWIYIGEMGEGYERIFKEITAFAKKDGVKLALNPGNIQLRDKKPILFQMIRLLEVLFVNKEEAQLLADLKSEEMHVLAGALSKLGPKHIIITDGKNGAYEYGGHELRHCPPSQAKVVETTGAGDAFASGYLAGMLSGLSCKKALIWGSQNSASVISHVGPTKGLLTRSEMMKKLK